MLQYQRIPGFWGSDGSGVYFPVSDSKPGSKSGGSADSKLAQSYDGGPRDPYEWVNYQHDFMKKQNQDTLDFATNYKNTWIDFYKSMNELYATFTPADWLRTHMFWYDKEDEWKLADGDHGYRPFFRKYGDTLGTASIYGGIGGTIGLAAAGAGPFALIPAIVGGIFGWISKKISNNVKDQDPDRAGRNAEWAAKKLVESRTKKRESLQEHIPPGVQAPPHREVNN